jgi:tetratricopeptide (TPR) repeat protein
MITVSSLSAMLAPGPPTFVTYAREDIGWAKWVGAQLQLLGYDVELDAWSWRAGENFIARTNLALERAEIIVGVYSANYFNPLRYSVNEMAAAHCLTKTSSKTFIPIMVEDCKLPPLSMPLLPVRLVGMSEHEAIRELRHAMSARHGNGQAPHTWNPGEATEPVPYPLTKISSGPEPPVGIIAQPLRDEVSATVSESQAILSDLSKADVDPIYLEQAFADADDLARIYSWTSPREVFTKARALQRRIQLELKRNRNPRQMTDLYRISALALGVLAYTTLDLGDSAGAAKLVRSAIFCAERAGDSELGAWGYGTLSLISRFDRRYADAVLYAEKGLQQYTLGGSALARLYSNAAESYSNLGNRDEVAKYLRLSEEAIERELPLASTPSGIFYFPRAKVHYYAGSSLLQLSDSDSARSAEDHALSAVEQFHGGPENIRSYNDELVAHVHVARARLLSGQIDGVLPALQTVLSSPTEYRSSWHTHFLMRLMAETNRGLYKGSAEPLGLALEIEKFLRETRDGRASVLRIAQPEQVFRHRISSISSR